MSRIAPEELARCYREHAPALRLYARQWGSAGEDLVQEAFVRLAQQTPTPERTLAWLYQVVRNAAVAALRPKNPLRWNPGVGYNLQPFRIPKHET